MDVSTLRWLDRWVGVPVCALLTLHRRLVRRRERPEAVRRILFVKLAEQGSTVLAADALRHAVGRVGRENVFVLVFAENRFVLDAMGLVPAANVVTLDARTPVTAIRSIIDVLGRLRALAADAAVDLEFFARSSAIFTYLSGAGCRVGLHSHAGEGPWRGDLMTHRLVYNPYLHTAQVFLLMALAIDDEADHFPAWARRPPETAETALSYSPPPGDLEAARQLVRRHTRQPDVPPIVLLNANCSDMLPLRRWDRSRYAELARRLLSARPDLHVLLTGGAVEIEEARRLAADVASARCVSVAGATTFGQLLALYTLSQVLVTNDSGPAHFATLTPIDVVTLFGPETPALFAARTPRSHVLHAGLACSPCVNAYNNRTSACRDNLCMQRITVDQVLDATLSALDGRSAERARAVR